MGAVHAASGCIEHKNDVCAPLNKHYVHTESAAMQTLSVV